MYGFAQSTCECNEKYTPADQLCRWRGGGGLARDTWEGEWVPSVFHFFLYPLRNPDRPAAASSRRRYGLCAHQTATATAVDRVTFSATGYSCRHTPAHLTHGPQGFPGAGYLHTNIHTLALYTCTINERSAAGYCESERNAVRNRVRIYIYRSFKCEQNTYMKHGCSYRLS